jgi:hypothetical protein
VTDQSLTVVTAGLTRSSTSYSFPAFEDVVHDVGAFYTLAGQAQFDDGAPLQPRAAVDVSLMKTMPHGAVLRGATYLDLADFDPVVGQAVTDGSIYSEPSFDAPGWYPSVLFELNRFDTQASLALVLGQYHADQETERLYSDASFDIYYHDSATDWKAPALTSLSSALQSGEATIVVEAADSSGIETVVVAYTSGTGTWESVELEASGIAWTGSFPASFETRFFVQIVDGAGNVTVGDHGGRYFTPGQGSYHVYLPFAVRDGQ